MKYRFDKLPRYDSYTVPVCGARRSDMSDAPVVSAVNYSGVPADVAELSALPGSP